MAGCGDEPQARNGGNIPKTFDKKSWWDDSYYLWLYQNARSWLEVGQVGCIFWMVLQILLKRTYRIVYCGSGFMAHPLPSSRESCKDSLSASVRKRISEWKSRFIQSESVGLEGIQDEYPLCQWQNTAGHYCPWFCTILLLFSLSGPHRDPSSGCFFLV